MGHSILRCHIWLGSQKMTTKFKAKRIHTPRITQQGMHILVKGRDALGQETPPHEYTETTKSLNELVDYYVEAFPLTVRVMIDVAVMPPSKRAGWATGRPG